MPMPTRCGAMAMEWTSFCSSVERCVLELPDVGTGVSSEMLCQDCWGTAGAACPLPRWSPLDPVVRTGVVRTGPAPVSAPGARAIVPAPVAEAQLPVDPPVPFCPTARVLRHRTPARMTEKCDEDTRCSGLPSPEVRDSGSITACLLYTSDAADDL